MKTFSKFLFSLAALAVFAISCSDQNEPITEDTAEPVAIILDAPAGDVSGFVTAFDDNLLVLNTEVQTRDHCPAYESAKERLDAIREHCEWEDSQPTYCQYLETFYRIRIAIALIKCYPEQFCGFCPGFINFANQDLQSLILAGAHPDYIQDIMGLIEELQHVCSEC